MPKQSGVNPNLFKAWDFSDHIWSRPQTHRPDLLELVNRCVIIDGFYWLKIAHTNTWREYKTKVAAYREAINTWLNGTLSSGTLITTTLIDTFFEGTETSVALVNNKPVKTTNVIGSCPTLDGKIFIPMGPRFLTYKNKHYLNYQDMEMLDGDPNHLDAGKLILVMIYRALCNGTELDLDRGVEGDIIWRWIENNKFPTHAREFHWVMNWLAAIVQKPGINLQTNLWIAGQQQGVGKGTLVELMKLILGSNAVGELNQLEVESGWTDHMLGKCLLVTDEFDNRNTRFNWDKWIKHHTTNIDIPIRVRHRSAYDTLNISNFIKTTNSENPLNIGRSDRRNMFIKTTDDPYWKNFALGINIGFIKKNPNGIASGFAYVLETLKVDFTMANEAFNTELKNQIIADSITDVEEWIRTDLTVPKNKAMASTRLYEDYFTPWFKKSNGSDKVIPPSHTVWGRGMRSLKVLGIEHSRTNQEVVYKIPVDLERMAERKEEALSDVEKMMKTSVSSQEDVTLFEIKPSTRPIDILRAALKKLDTSDMPGV